MTNADVHYLPHRVRHVRTYLARVLRIACYSLVVTLGDKVADAQIGNLYQKTFRLRSSRLRQPKGNTMKRTIALFAVALAFSTSASAWNIFDTLNVIRTINDTARTAAVVQQAQQPVVVVTPQAPPSQVTWIRNADGTMVRPVAPAITRAGCNPECEANLAAGLFNKDGDLIETHPEPLHVTPYVATSADAVTTTSAEPATDCPVVDNVDARVCIKTDKGAVVCGTYVGPQL